MKNFHSLTISFCMLLSLANISARDLSGYPIANLKNPLIDEPGMSDPHMLIVNDTCYLFTGHDIGFGVPDWIMPDWRIFMSVDLQEWRHVGTISPKDNIMGDDNTSCWAGDIAERNGKYYWYYSNRKEGAGVMVADRPEGPYKEALGDYLIDSFDPTILIDDDNTPYIIYGEGTYKIARLKESMIELDEEPKKIVIDGKDMFKCCGDKNSLHKYKDTYYLCYSGLYATSKNIYGPYYMQGLIGRGFGLDTHWGHNDFFVWKDRWYQVWCRYQNRSKDRIRDSFIAPIYHDDDGAMFIDTRHIDKKYSSSGAE